MDDKLILNRFETNRINVHEYFEVEYWSKKFGIKPDQLRRAVKEAGTSVNEVRQYLQR
jgi:hypothetical protein